MSSDFVVDRLQVFRVDSGGAKNWVFVKLTTASGIVGWGECYSAPDRDGAITLLAERLGAYLLGRDVRSIRHFMRVAYLDIATKRGSMDFYCALSGVEAAMWDALGKALDQPVHSLLGGAVRERIRVYANGWTYNSHWEGDASASIVEGAKGLVARGFTALKVDPFPGPWREQLDRHDEATAIATVAALRDAVGPDVDILIEGHRRFDTQTAIRLAHRLEPFDPFWFEEPVHSYDIPGLREVRERTRLPIVSGEGLYTKVEFRDLLSAHAADIINPDVANSGGILELTEIAGMASTHGVAVAPHNYNSTSLALAATVTVSALISNFLITEYFVNFEERAREIADELPEVVNGYIAISQRPGLGVNLNEEALAEFPAREPALRRVRSVRDE